MLNNNDHRLLDGSSAYRLLSYRSHHIDQIEQDQVEEIAALLDLTHTQARKLRSEVLSVYHAQSQVPPVTPPDNIDPTVFSLVVHVTQPYRIPTMTKRMDRYVSLPKKQGDPTTFLDYGGGGGKDSILFAKLGCAVTYSDLLGNITTYVRKRFSLRQLDIQVKDVRNLSDSRYDIVNSMDVIEHVYDVEYVTADTLARIEHNGHLLCHPTFQTSWNGDHFDKNAAYATYFGRMLEGVGFPIQSRHPLSNYIPNKFLLSLVYNFVGLSTTFHCRRERPVAGSVEEERRSIRYELYKLSKRFSLRKAMVSMLVAPAFVVVGILLLPMKKLKIHRQYLLYRALSNIIDNLAVYRVSRHRLQEMDEEARRVGASRS